MKRFIITRDKTCGYTGKLRVLHRRLIMKSIDELIKQPPTEHATTKENLLFLKSATKITTKRN